MPSFNFDTGLKTFDINGDPDRTISFPPSDAAFIRRLFAALEKLEECQKKHSEEIGGVTETEKLLDMVDAADCEIRVIIDGIFEAGVSDTIFGKINICGVAGGVPVWAGFIISLISECDEYMAGQEKAANPKLKKLLSKYGKKK